MPAAHRVVGVGEVDQRRAGAAGGEEQRLGVLGVVAVGDGDEAAAEAGDMVGEGRVGAGRGDDRRAGGDQQADEVAEQAVDALADDDVRGPDAVVGGERGLEVEHLGVAVLPGLGGGARPSRRRRAGEGPKTLSLAPRRAAKRRPSARSWVSGPTKGTVAGRLAASGVRRMAGGPRV